MNSSRIKKTAAEIFEAPAFSLTGPAILTQLKRAIEKSDSFGSVRLEQKRFGALIGAPRSTINDWFASGRMHSGISILCALERLSDEERVAVLREICRECPRLSSPRLSHNTGVISLAGSIASKPVGVTLVTGRSRSDRTYVVTAIGNSLALRIDACGFDPQPPRACVPVPGVKYAAKTISESRAAELMRELWPSIASSTRKLIILNEVWRHVPELHEQILSYRNARHLIISGTRDEKWSMFDAVPHAELCVAPSATSPGRLNIDVRMI